MKKFSILSLFAISLLLSCNKDSNTTQNKDSNALNITFRNIDYSFSDYSDEFSAFWNATMEYYTMEVLCACNCNARIKAQEALTKFAYLLPYNFQNPNWNYNCEELELFWGSCSLSLEEKRDSLSKLYVQNSFLTLEEANLLNDLFTEAISEDTSTNFQYYRTQWHELQTVSSVNNGVSAFIIETFATGLLNPPDIIGDKDPQAILQKLCAAAFAGYWSAITDEFGPGGDGTPSDHFFENIAWGAVGGFIGSL